MLSEELEEDWDKVYSYEEKRLKSLTEWTWHITPNCLSFQLRPSKDRQKVPPTPEDLQHLCQKLQPTPVISLGNNRENLAAQGRCLDGSYLTPYCRCDKKCYRFDTSLGDYPPEHLPIWLAYCRQYRQSHCFDIDDLIDGRVGPLNPSQNFNGRFELLMELANHSINDYNEKEYNVFKYKVMKIEKVNCCEATSTYWMTVKVIISLPSCEFCFGLLPGNVAEGKEP
ncbi:hypothetical protein KY290_008031 [Solanum tuberosum]|uniref:Uncharacterized protein n=1 Tax=Solanum tuberosum TaxID=4113 RepID=A0ABQ7W7A1_SOLTU|nr:hypothetical protein KY290_008031 [Solanum tuberosum]